MLAETGEGFEADDLSRRLVDLVWLERREENAEGAEGVEEEGKAEGEVFWRFSSLAFSSVPARFVGFSSFFDLTGMSFSFSLSGETIDKELGCGIGEVEVEEVGFEVEDGEEAVWWQENKLVGRLPFGKAPIGVGLNSMESTPLVSSTLSLSSFGLAGSSSSSLV